MITDRLKTLLKKLRIILIHRIIVRGTESGDCRFRKTNDIQSSIYCLVDIFFNGLDILYDISTHANLRRAGSDYFLNRLPLYSPAD